MIGELVDHIDLEAVAFLACNERAGERATSQDSSALVAVGRDVRIGDREVCDGPDGSQAIEREREGNKGRKKVLLCRRAGGRTPRTTSAGAGLKRKKEGKKRAREADERREGFPAFPSLYTPRLV